jgi:SAM-dependent methyltransferase
MDATGSVEQGRVHAAPPSRPVPGPGDAAFTSSMADLYDRHLAPMIFEPYALDLSDRVAALDPTRVLEIAAGTGVATRALARALPARVDLVATDLNPAMLERAAAVGTPRPVRWQQADATHLPFDDAGFDVVACQFGVMFFPDKVQAISVWDRLEENDFTDTVMAALAHLFPRDPPRFMARTPHGYFDQGAISRDLAGAGFVAAPRFETVAARSHSASAQVTAIALCQGTPLRSEIEARAGVGLAEATSACAAALASRFGEGPIDGKIQAHLATVQA